MSNSNFHIINTPKRENIHNRYVYVYQQKVNTFRIAIDLFGLVVQIAITPPLTHLQVHRSVTKWVKNHKVNILLLTVHWAQEPTWGRIIGTPQQGQCSIWVRWQPCYQQGSMLNLGFYPAPGSSNQLWLNGVCSSGFWLTAFRSTCKVAEWTEDWNITRCWNFHLTLGSMANGRFQFLRLPSSVGTLIFESLIKALLIVPAVLIYTAVTPVRHHLSFMNK